MAQSKRSRGSKGFGCPLHDLVVQGPAWSSCSMLSGFYKFRILQNAHVLSWTATDVEFTRECNLLCQVIEKLIDTANVKRHYQDLNISFFRDLNYQSPLHIAAAANSLEAAEVLVQKFPKWIGEQARAARLNRCNMKRSHVDWTRWDRMTLMILC